MRAIIAVRLNVLRHLALGEQYLAMAQSLKKDGPSTRRVFPWLTVVLVTSSQPIAYQSTDGIAMTSSNSSVDKPRQTEQDSGERLPSRLCRSKRVAGYVDGRVCVEVPLSSSWRKRVLLKDHRG